MNTSILRLRDLRRQFGRKLVKTATKSAIFVESLRRIRTDKVTIRVVEGPCRAYYDRETRTIHIAKGCPRIYKITCIVHEFVHALVQPIIDPIAGVTGRQEFIDRCIDAETEAIVWELKCIHELIKAGVRVPNRELRWYRIYKRGGRPAIRRALCKAETSTTGQKYPEYYGCWYDDVVPKRQRRP